MRFLNLLSAILLTVGASHSVAQPRSGGPPLNPSLYQDLRYRLIGPFRAGRTVGAAGIPTQPNVFFVGVNNGGVWKTDDSGRTWRPIFDQVPTGSVGDIAVSPSHPDVLYVGTGEGLHRPDLGVGDGIFKSTDGGGSWTHAGLGDIQQVGRLIVHPKDPETVFVAGMGHPYGPNEERGVFRTNDGGRTWTKVLYVDQNTGASQVEFDPTQPATVYAALWAHREGPWENGSFSGKTTGLYKSTDSGATWRKLINGLPGEAEGLGRINFCVAPDDPRRLYALVSAGARSGVYRSEDAGESWQVVSSDRRLGVDIRVHPRNRDVVFAAGTASYRSDDGGKTWTSIKGAPGGDDYQRFWINPLQPDIMLFTADQGATITQNGGKTWSSWYNQPTAQLYHVTADRQFPYWVYGGQQESGAIGIASRGDGGQISLRDWIGVGADEYAYVAPDPLNPDIIYGGRVQRFNRKTGQSQNVAPETLRSGQYRILRTMPLLFHPADPKMLLFATNVLWKTTSGGERWEIISPDLSREKPDVPPSVGDFRTTAMDTMPRRGVIYSVGASPVDVNTIWAGTDDGLVHVTRDGGKRWTNVTPKALRSWDKVSQVVASHFDLKVAYISVNALRRDDSRPYVYRTHDGGLTWQLIVSGMHDRGPVNVVREDPKQAGLLFAGTEREVYFSIDDGALWKSLRMNMPASSVRDLVIAEDDLVVGTHGRSIWILDNISPLRELSQAARAERAHLFGPPVATRVRFNMFSDTPFPPEEPAGANPPDGAILDYALKGVASSVVVEIVDARGEVVRRLSSADEAEAIDETILPYPTYWFRPPQPVSTAPGHHRVVWDLRYPTPPGSARVFSIAAIRGNTPSGPVGPYVGPGRYSVRLTVDGAVTERSLDVRMDPRVTISAPDLQRQTDLSLACYRAYVAANTLRDEIDAALRAAPKTPRRVALQKLRGTGRPGDQDLLYGSITRAPVSDENVVHLQEKFQYVLSLLQAADAPPTSQAFEAVKSLQEALGALQARFQVLR